MILTKKWNEGVDKMEVESVHFSLVTTTLARLGNMFSLSLQALNSTEYIVVNHQDISQVFDDFLNLSSSLGNVFVSDEGLLWAKTS